MDICSIVVVCYVFFCCMFCLIFSIILVIVVIFVGSVVFV